MKYILILTFWAYPPNWPNEGVPTTSKVIEVNRYNSLQQCLNKGKLASGEVEGFKVINPPMTYRCIEQ